MAKYDALEKEASEKFRSKKLLDWLIHEDAFML